MNFEQLPADALTELLLQCPIRGLAQWPATCRKVQAICSGDYFWQLRTRRDYPLEPAPDTDTTWKEWYQTISEAKIDLTKLQDKRRDDYVSDDLLPKIFSRLRAIQKRSSEPAKMYFSGEGDSNQTTFERKSNHLQIGVVSNSEFVALCLLHFVRILVDGRPDLLDIDLFDRIADGDVEGPVTLTTFLDVVSRSERDYLVSFGLNDLFEVTLGYGKRKTLIQTTISGVDVWTIPRIIKALKDIEW